MIKLTQTYTNNACVATYTDKTSQITVIKLYSNKMVMCN